jgi:hypothetical protein
VPTDPRFHFLLPPPPVRRNEQPSSKTVASWLGPVFWSCLLATALAVVWSIECGLEVTRAAQRVREAQDEGQRVASDAEHQLVLAEKVLNDWSINARDLGENEIKNVHATMDLKAIVQVGLRERERLASKIEDAQAKVKAAEQTVADASAVEERLVAGARLERAQSRRSLFLSMIAVAVGAIITTGAGWTRRRGMRN